MRHKEGGQRSTAVKFSLNNFMCYESMYWSKDHQIKLLKERKKALKERLDKIDEMIETMEKEEEKVTSEAAA
jgi:hypothetical protein